MIIVKRHGKKEKFDERKLYGSIYAAALTAGYGEMKAEKLAHDICSIIKKKARKILTSDNLRTMTITELKKKDRDVAFLYETHLDIS